MTPTTVTACRHCGRPIRWARTPHGSLIALDAHPNTTGCIDIHNGLATSATPEPGRQLWHPHHSICPDTTI